MPRLLTLLLIGLLCVPAPAQDSSGVELADRRIHTWVRDQAQAWRGVEHIAFDEETDRVVDGPFGKHRTELRARVEGAPEATRWRREVRWVRHNERIVEPRRWERHARRMERRIDEGQQVHFRPERHLSGMRPVSRPTVRELDGRPALHVVVAPRRGDAPVEQLTLWFTRDGTRLLRTSALVRPPRSTRPLAVTTDYERVGRLDLPRRRRMEGTLQVRRRTRTFTMLLDHTSVYDGYRIRRERP